MAASSKVLVYSLANFNGTVVFQVHHQDADFTNWLKRTKPTYQGITCNTENVPEVQYDEIYLRGKNSGANDKLVTYTPSSIAAATIVSKIHKALEEAVARYRREKGLDAVEPSSCTVNL